MESPKKKTLPEIALILDDEGVVISTGDFDYLVNEPSYQLRGVFQTNSAIYYHYYWQP